jgi:glucosyl-3-phosphoglycerate synthase
MQALQYPNMKSDDWLHTHTFHHSQFEKVSQIVKEKEKQGITISLCIPAFNEEKTIGKEIVILKSELVTRYHLLDKLAVIDSGSTDRTREIAAAFGADVYLASDVLPEIGEKRGKGENLWKAVYQLQGDILVFIDAGIKNIQPHFVYGLVAPLLYYPDMKYVKAFYEHPLTYSQNGHSCDGGYIIETLIRSLFSLFFLELTTIIHPLSVEYAARREILERIPFPIGDSVEISHLIDVYRQWSLDAIGQTDLDQLVHQNHSTRDVGSMLNDILHIFLSRLTYQEIVRHLSGLSHILYQIQTCNNSHKQGDSTISDEERPPMIEVPAYQEKFGLDL